MSVYKVSPIDTSTYFQDLQPSTCGYTSKHTVSTTQFTTQPQLIKKAERQITAKMATLPPNIQITDNPVKARSLTSTATIAPGTPILTLPPLLLLPSQAYLPTICTHCLSTSPPPRACTRCRSSFYCSPACQKANWSAVHSKECKPLARVSAQDKGNVPTPVRLLMQILLKDDVRERLSGLEGHEGVWRAREEWKDLEMMSLGAVTFAGKGEAEDDVKKACEIMCKVSPCSSCRNTRLTGRKGAN